MRHANDPGTQRARPELARLLDHLRPGDVVTVTRLDRLARSTRDLLDIAERIREAGAGLRSLAEPWADTTTPAGRTVTEVAGLLRVHRSTLYRALERSEEVTQAEAKRRGAFQEDALSEQNVQAAGGDQGERQEEMPMFLDDEGPMEPPAHVSTVRLHEILAGLSDAELAAWPAQLAARENERRGSKKT